MPLFSGSPYLGKPSDMWALGVVLFTMLYGQFPFYDSVPQELFRKIKAADFKIPRFVSLYFFSIVTQQLINCTVLYRTESIYLKLLLFK